MESSKERSSSDIVGDHGARVKSAGRALHILETLAFSDVPLTLSDLARQTGYPRSSLHALLATLHEMNWIEEVKQGGSYGIGPNALLTGTAYLDKDPVLPHARKTLENLRQRLDFTIHYARLVDGNVLYLASRYPVSSENTISRIGRMLPAHATALGQALLAERTDFEVRATLPDHLESLTPETITDLGELLRELAEVRTRGWSYEVSQNTVGVACVAVVIDYRFPQTDAISCSMPIAKATPEVVNYVGSVIREEAADLSILLRRLGIR